MAYFDLPLATLKAMLLLIASVTNMVPPPDWQPQIHLTDHLGSGCDRVNIKWQANSDEAEGVTQAGVIYVPEGVDLTDPHKYCVINHELTHAVQYILRRHYKANYIELDAYKVQDQCLKQFGRTLQQDQGWTQEALNKMFNEPDPYIENKSCRP